MLYFGLLIKFFQLCLLSERFSIRLALKRKQNKTKQNQRIKEAEGRGVESIAEFAILRNLTCANLEGPKK